MQIAQCSDFLWSVGLSGIPKFINKHLLKRRTHPQRQFLNYEQESSFKEICMRNKSLKHVVWKRQADVLACGKLLKHVLNLVFCLGLYQYQSFSSDTNSNTNTWPSVAAATEHHPILDPCCCFNLSSSVLLPKLYHHCANCANFCVRSSNKHAS